MVAAAGSGDYGALTVGIQAVANAVRLFTVPRGAFRPVPNVDSAVVRIVPHRPSELSEPEEQDLRTLTRAAFSWRRKQLQNILRNAPEYGLTADQLEHIAQLTALRMSDRPEQVKPEEFVALARALRELGYPQEQRLVSNE